MALQKEAAGYMLMPTGVVTFSAWTDLWTTPENRPSYAKNKDTDALLKAEWLNNRALIATATKQDEYAKRKKLSPVYASLESRRFPPLLMQVGTSEILEDGNTPTLSSCL